MYPSELSPLTLRAFEDTEAKTIQLDFSDEQALKKEIAPFNPVVGDAPGFISFQTAGKVIYTGKIMANVSLILNGEFDPKGVSQSENLADKETCHKFLLIELKKRGC